MAGLRLNFSITGDVSKALAAMSKLANGIADMALKIQAVDRITGGMVDALDAFQTKATSAWNRAINGAKNYINQLKAARSATAATAGAPVAPGGGVAGAGAGVPPGTTGALAGISAAGANAFSVLTGAAGKFGSFALNVFKGASGAAVSFAATVLSKVGGSFLGIGKTGLQMLGGIATVLGGLSRGMLAFIDVVRITAQGITNMGRTLFFFVTIPIIGFLTSASKAAIDFEDSMTRVQKTTGLTSVKTAELREMLRDLARNSASSHVEIAQIAEVIGQLGVTSVPAIYNLTQIFEMMSQTIDMSSADVASSLGKIANSFQWNLNNSSDEVFRLANVINYLENTTASSAKDIIVSMSKWGQAAAMLNITAAEAAGLSAALVSMGLSEEEAGTALKRMSSQLIKNAADVSALMKSNQKYATTQSTLNAINEDAVQVFLDIASAAAAAKESGQNAEALNALISIGDERGGRALAAMAGNIQFVTKCLQDANSEWERHNSLVYEYNRAMQSTKNQMKAFKNNINDAAITVGDALLPVINQVIVVLIPALQMFSNWFKNLSKKTQMAILAFTALGIAAGPLVMMFGQLLHGIFLIAQGFGLLIKAMSLLASGIKWLAPILGGALKGVLGWPGIIALALVGVLKILAKLGVDVSGFFLGLAKGAAAWGQKLMDTYGTGLAKGAQFVLNIISKIAELIAGFFEAHSPPKTGPLKNIDKWGSAVLQAYLDGFSNADFSALEDIGKTIETILTRGVGDDDLPGVLQQYAQARVVLAQLIQKFNQTGQIDEGMLTSATDGLGEMGDEIRELIRLQLQYNRLQEELAALEERRKNALKTYDEEIAGIGASNMSIEDKVKSIRASQRARDDSLRGIDKEKQALEDQSDEMKTQLDFQKNMIDAMNEQDDLFARIADALEKLSKSGKDAGGGMDLGSYSLGEVDTSGLDASLQDAQEKIMSFRQKVAEGKMELSGFFDAWSGQPQKPLAAFGMNQDQKDMYDTMYKIGEKAREIYDWAVRTVDKVKEWKSKIEDAKTAVTDFIKNFNLGDALKNIGSSVGQNPIVQKIVSWLQEAWGTLQTLFGPFFDTLMENLGPVWDTLVSVWDTSLKPALEQLGAALQNWGKVWGEVWTLIGPIVMQIVKWVGIILGGVLATIIGVVLGVINGIAAALPYLITAIGNIISGIITVFTGIFNFLVGIGQTIWGVIQGIFTGNWSKALEGLKTLWTGIKQIFSGIFNTVVAIVVGLVGAVWGFISGFVKGIIAWFVGLYNTLVGHSIIPDLFNKIWTIITTVLGWVKNFILGFINSVVTFFQNLWSRAKAIWNGLVETIVTFVQNLIDRAIQRFEMLKAMVAYIWDSIKDKAAQIWDNIKAAVEEKIETVKTTVTEKIDAIKQYIQDKVSDFKTAATEFIQAIIDGIQEKVDLIKTTITDKIDAIKTWITDNLEDLKSMGQNVIQGIIDGITSKTTDFKNMLVNLIKNGIDALKKLLGIASPSKLFAGFGKMTMKGMVNGINQGAEGVMAALNSVAADASGIFPSVLDAQGTLSFAGAPASELDFGAQAAAPINIHIHNPVIRDEADIDRLAEAIKEKLAGSARRAMSYGGLPSI